MRRSSPSCTVWYGDCAQSFLLPDTLPANVDSYTFLKAKLCKDFPELAEADIEVHALGANLPGLWPPQHALQPGTYRVLLKSGSTQTLDKVVERPWQFTICTQHLDRSGYFHEGANLPQKLCLQLDQDFRLAGDRLNRQPEYQCEQHMLEFPFFKHFKALEKEPSMLFKVSAAAGLQEQENQLNFICRLSDCKLMLRIPNFSPDHELLLLPCQSGVHGFVRYAGTVQDMAKQELQHFVRIKRLVLVCDLDQTLVHTIPAEHLPPTLGPQMRARMFDLSLHNKQFQAMLCAPRANLLEMYLTIKDRYEVYYLTAGNQQYGESVVRGIREYLLADQQLQLSSSDRRWIAEAAKPGNVLSSAYSQGRQKDPNRNVFKTLGMLLKIGYVPEYAAKIVVILDDRPDVWKVSSDRKLVHPILPQELITSDGKPSTERALWKFASVACELSSRAFAQQQMGLDVDSMKSLEEVMKDVAVARLRRGYQGH